MKMLVTTTQRLGPFNLVEQTEAGFLVNGEVEYPSSVIGDAHIEEATEADMPQPEIIATPRHITKLAFRKRFSRSEKAIIELAAVDDPTADMVQRERAATIRADLADAAAAEFIDLDRGDTRAGVHELEAGGILGEGRAAEILDAPIQSEECFHP